MSQVFVIDDEESVRRGLESLFRSVKLKVELFASGLRVHAAQAARRAKFA